MSDADFFTDEILRELQRKPWLRPFIEDGDSDLEPAKGRWQETQQRYLARSGVGRVRVVHGQTLTTSFTKGP